MLQYKQKKSKADVLPAGGRRYAKWWGVMSCPGFYGKERKEYGKNE